MSKKTKLCMFTAVFTILLVFILIIFDEPQISFSNASGFYEENIELKINSTKGTIYYTTDGTEPTENSIKYDGPISLEPIYNGGHVIRAIAISNRGKSNVINGSFFIGKQICERFKARNIVSIITNEDLLFGEDGITVFGKEYMEWVENGEVGQQPTPNYNKRGIESEIPIVFELISDDLSFNQNVGLRLAGASTRTPDHQVKRYNLYARNEYSYSNLFDRKIFSNIRSHKLCIRESFGTAFINKLTAQRNVTTQDSIPISLFINGKYYYDSYLMEKYDERYFIEHYNIHEDNLLVLKNGVEEIGNGTGYEEFNKLMDFVKNNDLSVDENYNELCQMIDIQSYIDYMAINIYINNLDFDDTRNVVMWKAIDKTSNSYEDGRWRFALYDLDAFSDGGWIIYFKIMLNTSVDDIYKINTFTYQTPFVSTSVENQTLFSALKTNEKFCQQFLDTFIEISDTCFDLANIEKAMNNYGYDYFTYNFLKNRKSYILDYLYDEFNK